jgi:hypothetical protein
LRGQEPYLGNFESFRHHFTSVASLYKRFVTVVKIKWFEIATNHVLNRYNDRGPEMVEIYSKRSIQVATALNATSVHQTTLSEKFAS